MSSSIFFCSPHPPKESSTQSSAPSVPTKLNPRIPLRCCHKKCQLYKAWSDQVDRKPDQTVVGPRVADQDQEEEKAWAGQAGEERQAGGAHLTLSVSSLLLLSAGLAPGLIRHHGAALLSGDGRHPRRQRCFPITLHSHPVWNQHCL